MPNGTIDWERLRGILNGPAGANLPAALRSRMEADLAKHDSEAETSLMTVRPDNTRFGTVSTPVKQTATDQLLMAPGMFAVQLIHDVTAGVMSKPFGIESGADIGVGEGPLTGVINPTIKVASGLLSMFAQGKMIVSGLSYLGKVPRIATTLEAIPQRLSEIGLGAVVNGGIDMLRADPLVRDAEGKVTEQSWLDPSAKLAAPLINAGVPERLALGLAGMGVGGVLGPAFIGIASGIESARAAKLSRTWTPDQVTEIRDGLKKAGVVIDDNAGAYDVAKQFTKNFRKIELSNASAQVVGEQLAREQYILGEILASSNDNLSSVVNRSLPGVPEYVSETMPHRAVGPEDLRVREISRKIKAQDPDAIKQAAQEMAARMEGPAVLVPIPGSKGDTGANRLLAEEIAKLTGSRVEDVLGRSSVVESSTVLRRQGKPGLSPDAQARSMSVKGQVDPNANVILIDNVETSGATAEGAARALGRPDAKLLTYSKAPVPEFESAARAVTNEDGRLLAGVFRNNPGGVNVVSGVSNVEAIELAKKRLGVNFEAAVIPSKGDPNTLDVIFTRPKYEYPTFSDKSVSTTLTKKITDRMRYMSKEAATSVRAPKTTELYILADGEPIRGSLNTTAMIQKMKLPIPVIEGVERSDVALREAGRLIRMEIPEPGRMVIELPSRLTQEQFNALGRGLDAQKFENVLIKLSDGTEKAFNNPFGAQVQDYIASAIKPKSVGNSLTPELVQQYRSSGVFKGQAVVLEDGTAGEIVKSKGATGYIVKESLTGKEMLVHPKRLTLVPSSLTSELQPSNLFTGYMTEAERNALVKLRTSISKGWDKEITKYKEFERFAASRGFLSNSLRGGKVELFRAEEGAAETVKFQTMKAAIEYIRKSSGPMAELTADDIQKSLGPDRNLGFIGGGGMVPRPNELVPINWARMEKTMESLPKDRGPSSFDVWFKPSLPLMRDLDKRFGTEMYKASMNLQSQHVAEQNFVSLWFEGRGGGKLPDGVTPLKNIFQKAGKDADWERISDWMEIKKGTPEEAALLASMTKEEQVAAQQLRSWYNAAYPAFGVEAAFVEDFMPRYREMLQSNGVEMKRAWEIIGGDPLNPPKGMDWISDHARQGLLDVYEKDARVVAIQYLRGAARNRFMKQAYDEAAEMVRMISDKNPHVALPLGNMMQAMRGVEFAEQRAMLNETFKRVMDNLPGQGTAQEVGVTAEKLVNYLTSAVYASTMGFRPSIALRNAKDVFLMAYPLYGGKRFYNAIGHALTREGVQEAMRARAIGAQNLGMFASDVDVLSQLPTPLKKVSEASMYLYESADDFVRAGTYFAAKYKAEDALQEFGKIASKGTPAQIDKAKAALLRETKLYLHGPEVEQEFLRRAGQSPDLAAQFAGKIASDMTNFLYGRGMQARWMRSTVGRFVGQFGTWSMWYLDYLTRLTRAATKGPNRADALGVLGRHALLNAAIVAAGQEVLDVDLSKWASYGALFYSGGPGWSLATGASTLMRGLGEVSSMNEDPLAQARVSEGSQIIWQTLRSYVPFYYAGQDALRLVGADNDTDALAAALGTKTTRDFQVRNRLETLLGGISQPFFSSSPALANQLNGLVDGTADIVDIRQVGGSAPGLQSGAVPSHLQPGTNPGAASQSQLETVSQSTPRGLATSGATPQLSPLPGAVPAATQYRGSATESTRPAEAKPLSEY